MDNISNPVLNKDTDKTHPISLVSPLSKNGYISDFSSSEETLNTFSIKNVHGAAVDLGSFIFPEVSAAFRAAAGASSKESTGLPGSTPVVSNAVPTVSASIAPVIDGPSKFPFGTVNGAQIGNLSSGYGLDASNPIPSSSVLVIGGAPQNVGPAQTQVHTPGVGGVPQSVFEGFPEISSNLLKDPVPHKSGAQYPYAVNPVGVPNPAGTQIPPAVNPVGAPIPIGGLIGAAQNPGPPVSNFSVTPGMLAKFPESVWIQAAAIASEILKHGSPSALEQGPPQPLQGSGSLVSSALDLVPAAPVAAVLIGQSPAPPPILRGCVESLPTAVFSKEDGEQVSAIFKFALIGKFSYGKPDTIDGTCYSDNRSNSRANTCNKPRLLEGMHLLDKRSTRAMPVAAMIHDNSTDRTAFVPATHHSNFCPINFRW
ncbi:hypothetical protein OROMI_021137 [Orobanche minor]